MLQPNNPAKKPIPFYDPHELENAHMFLDTFSIPRRSGYSKDFTVQERLELLLARINNQNTLEIQSNKKQIRELIRQVELFKGTLEMLA